MSHAIIALGQHTQSDEIWRGIPSSPLNNIHGQTPQAWHAFIAPAKHTRSDDVRQGMLSLPLYRAHDMMTLRVGPRKNLGQHTWSDDVGRGMTSSPLGNIHDCTTSGKICHHLPWATHKARRRRAWNAIIALGKHTRSDYIKHSMPSSPLGCTLGQTTSGMV